ncbi:MAG: flagellar brake protein [Fimbriimonadaceae bacterium]
MIQLLGLFALVFAGSFGLAWLLVAWRKRATRLKLAPGMILRLRGREGVYRASVISENALGWVLGAPIKRDHYVPLRPGELLVAEAAGENGACIFRTEVLSRDIETHQIVIARPQRHSRLERREMSRKRLVSTLDALLDGDEARVVDLSEHGARVATRLPLSKGERVRLDISGRPEPMFGWILEALPGGSFGYNGSEVRVRFES